MKLKIIYLVCFLVLLSAGEKLYAQTSSVKGTVTSKEDGTTLPGVNVIIKGTTIGVTTDVNGKYAIAVKPGEILVFSFVGFQIVEIPVGTFTDLNVV